MVCLSNCKANYLAFIYIKSEYEHLAVKYKSLKIEQFEESLFQELSRPVWPDWVIYYTLGNFLKPVETIICPNRPHF